MAGCFTELGPFKGHFIAECRLKVIPWLFDLIQLSPYLPNSLVFIGGVSCNSKGKQSHGIIFRSYRKTKNISEKGKRYSKSGSQFVLSPVHASRQANHSSGINTGCDALRILALSLGLDYTAKLVRLGQKPISPRKQVSKLLTSVCVRMLASNPNPKYPVVP